MSRTRPRSGSCRLQLRSSFVKLARLEAQSRPRTPFLAGRGAGVMQGGAGGRRWPTRGREATHPAMHECSGTEPDSSNARRLTNTRVVRACAGGARRCACGRVHPDPKGPAHPPAVLRRKAAQPQHQPRRGRGAGRSRPGQHLPRSQGLGQREAAREALHMRAVLCFSASTAWEEKLFSEIMANFTF